MLARKQWRKAVFPLTTAMICRLVVQEFEDGLSLVFVFGVLLCGMRGIRGAAWLACEILVCTSNYMLVITHSSAGWNLFLFLHRNKYQWENTFSIT